jgi:predicted O-methyltransferase YrrM
MYLRSVFVIGFFVHAVCVAYDGAAYNVPRVFPNYVQGWFRQENADGLKTFIKTLNPGCVVELGSWLGASAIYMGQLLPKSAELYCVDHWKGSIEHQSGEWAKMLPTLYEQFLSNVIHASLTHIIIPVRMDTIKASQELQITPQLIYVDASHDELSVFNDICAWYPKLAKGGIMCGDDIDAECVKRGVIKAAKFLDKKYQAKGAFWWFDFK